MPLRLPQVKYVSDAYESLASTRSSATQTASARLASFTNQLSPLEEYTSGFAQVRRHACG